MQVTRAELNPCTIELKVALESEAVQAAFERAFRRAAKNVKLPGFRPGHAPKQMVEQMVDPSAVAEAAADLMVRDSFPKALEQEKLEPHSQPSINITAIDRDGGKFEFVAKVPLAPQVELATYKGLKGEAPAIEVSDDEIEKQIEELRRTRSSRTAVSDRGIQEGDVAVLNIKPDGETGDGRNFMTIAGQTFPQLDSALQGMKSDEIKHLELDFPDSFQDKDWAGKKMSAHVSVRSISSVQLPELDDTFAKSLQTENVDELKQRMREAILTAKQSMLDDYVNEQLLEQLVATSTVHVPDTMWEQVASRRLYDLQQEQGEKGKSIEDYAKDAGMTVEQLVEAWNGEAKLHVQRAVIVQRIFELESMQLTEADLNKELVMMAREFNIDPRELLELMKKQNSLQELQFRSVFRKVTDFLRENAQISEAIAEATASKPKKSKKS